MNSGLVQLGSSQPLSSISTDITNPSLTSSLSQSLQSMNPSALILKAGLHAGSAKLTGQDINQSLSQFAFQVVGDIAQKQLTQALKQHQIASNSGNQDKQLYWQSQVSQWAEGGAYKVALHAIAGGLMAQATGSDFKTGALVAGASQALAGALTQKLVPSSTNSLNLASQQLNQQLKNQLHQQLATIVGGVTAQLSGEKAQVGMNIAGTADQFNRQMHYDDFIEKLTACHNQNSSNCQQLQQMAGVRNEFIEEVPELPESSVVINYNEDNEVVSYTVVNKSQGNRPVLIFEPKEFEAYKAGSLSTRGLFLLSPQWSFDIGSAALYADEEKSLGYITDAVTSPEYIFTAITSTMGASAYLGKSSVVTVPKGVDVAKGTGTVFDTIKATQPIMRGTSIPKSFEVSIGKNKSFWVHPNATKHMAENTLSRSELGSQAILTSFQQSVKLANTQGIEYGKMMNVGKWELIFSKGRSGDALPVIKHALYK